ncbi:uncharacterized protein BDFB_004997 [Asbolus verrucosus]|uniref:Uncharacterized protein n=1 Tax=Asbolus verrucosus TaxID=1661398 RepID=A0A482V9X4_ASBVE|nr:uncharacterized protein BDFB_004997 [Asbolus verrucosus]
MVEQQQSDDNQKNSEPGVKNSIKKLKNKFVPGFQYTLIIATGFNISMLVIGCLNVHKCPVNKNIPLFLIATGAIGIISKFTTYVRTRFSKHIQVVYFETSLYSVESIFFFLGSYWVYKYYKPSYDPTDGDVYCNKTAYLLAFIYLTFLYSLLLVMIFGCCCAFCCLLCLGSGEDTSKAGCKYSLLVAAICNFAMLVIGCLNVHKCPVNEKIPLYLIATGAIGLVSKFVSYFRRRISAHVQVVFFETSLYSVEAAFFFLGTFWVYKEYKPSFDPDEKDYCNETAYMFAFVHLTIYYCFIVFVAFVCCCIVCVAICVSATADTGVKYTLIIAAALNISVLVVGCLNVHKCPVNKNIPLFLIAVGGIGLMSKFISYIRERLSELVTVAHLESSLYSAEVVFCFLGSYWVFKEYQPSYDPFDETKYCNKTAYLFAFSYLIIHYTIALAVLLACCCFTLCCMICTYKVRTCCQDMVSVEQENDTGIQYTLITAAIFNFAMLVVGSLNVHKCPVNKNIPLFLIAIGAIGLVSKFVSYIRDRLSKHVRVSYIESALYSVETIFFFLGTYWVYKEFKPSYNPLDRTKYCNKTAYLFAFIYLTVHYTILIAMIFGCCCFVCCAMWMAKAENSRSYDVESQPTNTEAREALTTNDESEAKP